MSDVYAYIKNWVNDEMVHVLLEESREMSLLLNYAVIISTEKVVTFPD